MENVVIPPNCCDDYKWCTMYDGDEWCTNVVFNVVSAGKEVVTHLKL